MPCKSVAIQPKLPQLLPQPAEDLRLNAIDRARAHAEFLCHLFGRNFVKDIRPERFLVQGGELALDEPVCLANEIALIFGVVQLAVGTFGTVREL